MSNLKRKVIRSNPFNPLPKRRWKRGQPFGRTQDYSRLGSSVLYTHPTKGHRQRSHIRGLGFPLSKNDMTGVFFKTLGEAMVDSPRG